MEPTSLVERNYEELCAESCVTIRKIDSTSPECRSHIIDHHPIFPDKDQLLAELSKSKRKQSEVHRLELASSIGCFWVQHDFHTLECLNCLRELSETTLLELSDTTALTMLNPLQTIEDEERKLKLAMCIKKSQCFQVLFMPSAPMDPPHPIRLEKTSASELGSNSASTKLRQFIDIVPKNWLTLGFPEPHSTLDSGRPSANLAKDRNAGLDLNCPPVPNMKKRMREDSQALCNMKKRLKEYSQGSRLPIIKPDAAEAVINGEAVETNVYVLNWKKDTGIVERVKCLAQYGEMLLFLTRRSYAWMIKGMNSVDFRSCGDCGQVQVDSLLELNIYQLRPMSFIRISKILREEGVASVTSMCH